MSTSHNTLIPRSTVFDDPQRSSVQISPNGMYISYVAPRDGVKNIYIAPKEEPENAWPVTSDKDRGITKYAWAYDNKHILYLQDNNGDENWRIYKLNIDSLESTLLTPGDNIQARFQYISEQYPSHILVALNTRRPDYHDIYKIDLESGNMSLVFHNDTYADVVADNYFNIRFGQTASPDGGSIIYRIEHHTPHEHSTSVFKEIPPEHVFNTSIVHIDGDRNIAYYLDSSNRDTAALYQYDLTHDHSEILFADDAEINSVLFHPQDDHVQAVATCYLRSAWTCLDPQIETTFATLREAQPYDADIKIVSQSHDNATWIVAYISDVASPQYYLLDRNHNTIHHLFNAKPEMDQYTLSPMHPVEITARDGITLPSYLTIPAEYKQHNTAYIPHQPLPLVLLVHGGPHARDNWGNDPVTQWLANRGYAILSVNYRGSVGFGVHLTQAGFGEWGNKMHNDLIDAINWAISNGIADKEKIGIMGGSYGGYATLVGLTMTPDVFACGVDIVGPSNLVTLINSIPPYWKPIRSLFTRLVGGDPEIEEQRPILEQKSPITYVDNITKPLLIAQGKNDPRVKQAESDQIVAAMQAKDIPVTYAIYPDEGHGFGKPYNKIAFFTITEQFLHKHLGGRCEPVHDEIKNSSTYLQSNHTGIT